jgi:hypothetical protein
MFAEILRTLCSVARHRSSESSSAGGNRRMFHSLDRRGGLALAYSLQINSKEINIHHLHFEQTYHAAGACNERPDEPFVRPESNLAEHVGDCDKTDLEVDTMSGAWVVRQPGTTVNSEVRRLKPACKTAGGVFDDFNWLQSLRKRRNSGIR